MDAPGVDALAVDARSLDALRAQAKADPDKALKQAAAQFESLFMQMLLKSMRQTLPQQGPFDNDTTRTYTALLDQQLSQGLSGKGLGLAEAMARQLARASGAGAAHAAAQPGDAGAFAERMRPHAEAASQATGVPAPFILGQAALESGWGAREIPGSHNLFGIKAGAGWSGATVEAATTEYEGGEPVKRVEKFRAYGSYAEGFADYARLLAANPRYAAALEHGGDASAFAQGLAQGGYATDPAYAEKLTRVINSTRLGRGAA
jgi:flagellar protein FlgJ